MVKTPLSAETWEAARLDYLSGVSVKSLSLKYGVHVVSVYRMVKRWVARANEGRSATRKSTSAIGRTPNTNAQNLHLEAPKRPSEALAGLVSPDSGSQEYQDALSRAFKSKLLRSVDLLDDPRNWSEAKILFDMIRKADGLDKTDKGGPVSVLVNVGASISRRSDRVVEAVTVEDDGTI